MKISIVIVSYNAPKHLDICLDSCHEAIKNVNGEIIVVDNNSSEIVFEELKKVHPNIKFLLQKDNLGFAKANNIGVENALGEYVLILNPDTIIPENIVQELIDFHQSKEKIGFVGVRLIDTNGNFHPESKRNIPTAKNSFSKLFKRKHSSKSNNYYKLEVDEFSTAPCEILVGAFMFTTKQIYQDLEGFDNRYFMYGEDIDLSYSAELAGYKNYYKGDITVLHYKGESTHRDKKYYNMFFEAMMIFLAKYYKENKLNYFVLKSGILLKYWIEIIKYNFSREVKVPMIDGNETNYIQLKDQIELRNLYNQNVVLNAEKFSYKEILEMISQHSKQSISFYIQPKKKKYWIGDNKKIIEKK
ncbi:glycosyltransferase family 2 protein [Empedobacter sedimenti]|uniref:glycosyltransferase family 2 protein n=1 Tax=Empedobacter sedimenti TaxID=3042610 RepID=UPI0024A6D5FC|nr:glycosyltransferase family 2 protein [Empedobacter sedimenti]